MWKDLFDKIFLFFVMFGWCIYENDDFNEGKFFLEFYCLKVIVMKV